ncbi:MAG: DUF1173 family protein [Acetobacter orientalis]|uniref:DUF1173 family protein n=1 Tax=Acetobacter orientalis TaxID=146474 RepID=UPI0039EC2877
MRDWVTFPDGTRGRRSWDADPQRAGAWQRRLAQAWGGDERPVCDCRYQGQPMGLSVHRCLRQRGGEQVQVYHLARLRNQGALHHVACSFHEADPRRDGRSGYAAGVVHERDDGRIGIALRRGLRCLDVAAAPAEPAQAARQGGGQGAVRQARMTELGVLHLLWEEAGLNRWTPRMGRARRYWPVVREALDRAAVRIVPARNQTLSDRLAMIGYGDEDGPALLRETARSCGETWRILLLGIVDDIALMNGQGDQQFCSLRFDGAKTYNLRVSAAAIWHERVARRYPMAMAALARPRAERAIRVVGLVTATVRMEVTQGETVVRCRADDIALMEVEPDTLTPVSSSHELEIARALVEQRRSFVRPLRFDAGRDAVLSDFVLTDTDEPRGTPMEVFGRADEAYAARRAEKARYYDEVFGQAHWWYWDAVASPGRWPAFPPASTRTDGDDDV